MPERLDTYWVFYTQGGLYLAALEPLSEADLEVAQRFAKAFGFAYERFLELQEKEERNRQLEIENALERVRSRALGMHQSEDIGGVAVTLFQEVEELRFSVWRSAVEIMHEGTDAFEYWGTTSEGQLLAGTQHSIERVTGALPHLREKNEAWQRGDAYYYAHLEGDALQDAVRTVVEVSPGTFPEWEAQQAEVLPERLDLYFFFFLRGDLNLVFREPLSEGDPEVLQRFAEVFGFAYTRFLELQNAEAQARQAEQQAAVDRVRAEIATMRTSADLEQRLTPLIWKELTGLGVSFFRCGVFIADEEADRVSCYLTNAAGTALGAFDLAIDSDPTIRAMMDHWREGQAYTEQWDGQRFLDFMDLIQAQGQPIEAERFMDGPTPPGILVLHSIPFTHGVLYVGGESALSEEGVSLVKDLAAAFSVAYARYLDFQSLEEQNRAMSDANRELFELNQELQRERAVEHVRDQVQMMEEAADFEKVLSLLAEDLKAVGLTFDTCGIDVLDEPVDEPSMAYFDERGFRYTAYTIDPHGVVERDTYHIPAPFPPVNLEMVERFIAGEPWQGTSGQTAMVEVPVSGFGRLHLTASDRQEFTEDDIEALKEFASAIALGYARYLDIREIQEQTQRKSAFLASMSHELRTPMNAIKGFTNVVLRRGAERLSERHRVNLEKVIQASDQLLEMINDLMDLSKIEAGRMDVNPEPFDVKALITTCCATVSPLVAEKADVALNYEVPEDVGGANTDQSRVRQMVINLLSNAVKFTDSGSVTVSASRDGDQLVIALADTGKGIPADEIDTIFDEYRQVKGSDTEGKGTGLGLSITKRFAELLGGTVSVESQVGVGSTFTVRVPIKYAE